MHQAIVYDFNRARRERSNERQSNARPRRRSPFYRGQCWLEKSTGTVWVVEAVTPRKRSGTGKSLPPKIELRGEDIYAEVKVCVGSTLLNRRRYTEVEFASKRKRRAKKRGGKPLAGRIVRTLVHWLD